MTQGVKLVVRAEDKLVLGLKTPEEHYFNLPSRKVDGDLEPREWAQSLFRDLTEQDGPLIPVTRAKDPEFGTATSYVASWSGKLVAQEGLELMWVEPMDIMCGRWGLFARESFQKLGIINRPTLDLERLYKVSKKATSSGSDLTIDAIDAVLDEFTLLTDIGKQSAIDDILKQVRVDDLHADVLDAMKSFVEEMQGLKEGPAFVAKAAARIEEIDGPRKKYRLVGPRGVISDDVRGDARKYYKQRAKEFGEALRAGKLDHGFPGLHRGGEKIVGGRDGVLPPRPSPDDRLRRSPAVVGHNVRTFGRARLATKEEFLSLDAEQRNIGRDADGNLMDARPRQGETVRTFADRVREAAEEAGTFVPSPAREAAPEAADDDEEARLDREEEGLLERLLELKQKRREREKLRGR